MSTWTEVTHDGHVQVCAAPVKENVSTTSAPEPGDRKGAAAATAAATSTTTAATAAEKHCKK
jgi:hypothetical protein